MEWEVEMIEMLHKQDIFTMSYVFTPSDAVEMVNAGVDVVCVPCGAEYGWFDRLWNIR